MKMHPQVEILSFDYGLGAPDPSYAQPAFPCSEERLLWLSVLERAVNDAIFPRSLVSSESIFQIRRDARLWFKSDSTEIGSWIWLKGALRLSDGEIEHICGRIRAACEAQAKTEA